MEFLRNHLKQTILTILLIAGVIGSFVIFINGNSTRIANQNEEYLNELTSQRAMSVNSILEENLTFINSIAYLYSQRLNSEWAEVSVIREFEKNAGFDYLRFMDKSGDNYTSHGVQANVSDRDYFQSGMRGESGITYVLQSRVTGERQIGFYAPVRYDGNIIGVMVGFYGEEYTSKFLEYDLFGYEGDGWICDSDGTVIGTTLHDDAEGSYDNFFDYLKESGKCNSHEIELVERAFSNGDRISFQYQERGQTTTGYAVGLAQNGWVVVRNFPPEASSGIVSNANRNGIMLVVMLLAMFILYGLLIAVDVVIKQRKMKIENRNANYVSHGVSRLFEKFMTLNLDTGEYEYIVGMPNDIYLPSEGRFDKYCDSLFNLIPDEKNLEDVMGFMDIENLRKTLSENDVASIRVHAPNGIEEWYTFSFIVLERDEEGSARLLLVLSQDTTELYRKEAEEQVRLHTALKSAEKASQAKTEFLFNMSHDLRTPMNAIIGYTELAQADNVSRDQLIEYIGKIDTASSHLLSLINDILEMSRVESGKLTLEPEPMDLVEMMDEAREIFIPQMESKDIHFSIDTSRIKDRYIIGDRNRLSRIYFNLISNAYKFTEPGGSVNVTVLQTGSYDGSGDYELRVKDTGIGMSPEFVSRLFRPFERERTSTVSGIQGTGLGLSISKSILDLMGGTVAVRTEQGKGTEFIVNVSFELAGDRKPDERKGAGRKTADADFAGKRLLLAEDNEVNREIACMILKNEGFEIETADNGQIAVDMVRSSEGGYYDAVLMDIQMPVMDGYEATKAIRALENPVLAAVPVVAMTANAFKEDVDAALEAGMNGHIAKPIDVSIMLNTLAEVLK